MSKYRENYIRDKGEYIELLIYPHGRGYPIENNRIDKPEKVLGWIHHLTEKEAVTKEHIREFIEMANELGANVDYNA